MSGDTSQITAAALIGRKPVDIVGAMADVGGPVIAKEVLAGITDQPKQPRAQ